MSCCGAYVMPVELPAKTASGGPSETAPTREFVLTGRHVLLMLLAFFGVIGLVNAYFISVALKTLPGIEAKSAYEESQKFNRGLEAIASQDRKGWQVDVITGGFKAGGPLSVQLRDRAGVPILGMKVLVTLQRPTDARRDHVLTLTEQGNGVYALPLPDVEPGLWRVVLEVKRGNEREFYSEGRVVTKE